MKRNLVFAAALGVFIGGFVVQLFDQPAKAQQQNIQMPSVAAMTMHVGEKINNLDTITLYRTWTDGKTEKRSISLRPRGKPLGYQWNDWTSF